MAPYPTQQEIAAMFERMNGHQGGGFTDHIDENVQVEIMGHDHSTRGTHSSQESIAKEFFGNLTFIDWGKTSVKCRQVIGGGDSSWACVEAVGTGTTHKGKHINHEFACVANFNTKRKMA